MTPTLWIAVGAPLVGLLGVLLGLWLGQKRWKAEQAQKECALYEENLKATYLELWDVVQDIHIKLREMLGGLNGDEFATLLKTVNNFMMRKGLYIERDDRHLVLQYLSRTYEFLQILVEGGGLGKLVLISMSHDEMPRTIEQMTYLSNSADELRSKLRNRVREVVGAPPSDAWPLDTSPPGDLAKRLHKAVDDRRGPATRSSWTPAVLPPVSSSSGADPDDDDYFVTLD